MPSDELQTFLHALSQRDEAVARSTLEAFPHLVERTHEGLPLTLLAAYHGLMELAEWMGRCKKELDFFEAVVLGLEQRVRETLNRRPELVEGHSSDGFTALGLACYFRRTDLALALLDKGADPNARSRNTQQVAPLHAAVATGQRGLVRTLLNRGADPNLPQARGITPLHSAAHRGDEALCRLLLEHGADPTLHDAEGRNAHDHARLAGHTHLLPILEESPGK